MKSLMKVIVIECERCGAYAEETEELKKTFAYRNKVCPECCSHGTLFRTTKELVRSSDKEEPNMKDTKYQEAWDFLEMCIVKGLDIPKEVLQTLYELVKLYYSEK